MAHDAEQSPETIIEFSHDRLEDLIQALAYAAIDDFDACMSLMRDDGGDTFAWLEAGFNDFLGQLKIIKNDLQNALVRAEVSNRELEAKLETIERQQAAIRELSTPLIEVWSGVLCLPVVGIVDSVRSAEMTEALLEAIVNKQARMAIIDITGIDAMDTKTADHFIKMAKSVRLLGSECILSGINPAIAQTLTHIGVDLTGIRTMRNLRDALQAFLRDQTAQSLRLHAAHAPV
jgi:rsbT co-antagonist protein RsbR